MRSIFNINTIEELESAFVVYKKHMLNEHSLNLKKINKAKNSFAKFLGFENYSTAEAYFKEESRTPKSDLIKKFAKENNLEVIDLPLSKANLNTIIGKPTLKNKTELSDDKLNIDFNLKKQFEEILLKEGEAGAISFIKGLAESKFEDGWEEDNILMYFERIDKSMAKFFEYLYKLPEKK